MKADRIWMLSGDLIGRNKAVFRIPVYQRNYNWTKENCGRLLDDIKAILDNKVKKHFLGSIVFIVPKDGGCVFSDYTIIDGQQRVTTIMLLLKALADISQEEVPSLAKEINEEYLCNRNLEESQDDLKIKLKPINSDSEQFEFLLANKFEDMNIDGNIYINYNYCKGKLKKWIELDGVNPRRIFEALFQLEIVAIRLVEGEDDPQIIFESINSTGLELFTSDLIRNFLLMNAKNQKELYKNYWLSIEDNLRFGKDYTNLDLFFKHYIVCKRGAKTLSRNLYREFVAFFTENKYTNEKILKELSNYSEVFRAFITEKSNKYSENIKLPLRTLRLLKQTTSYPFLLHVFNDYEQKVITEETLVNILNFLVSYLLRRMVCGVPSNSLSGLFTSLYSQVFKVEKNKQKYYESINKYLASISTKDKTPTGEVFEEQLKNTNLYANLALCKFILMDIENGASKEILYMDTLQIEHLMPQTLNENWANISEEEHERFLHTLGNLTVTGYNSELSNKSFAEKKQIIIENSKANILNKDVINQDKWDVDTIKARAKRLSKIITERYAIETIKDNDIEFENTETIDLENYNEITGKKLSSFIFCNQSYISDTFKVMLIKVLSLLDNEKPGLLKELALKEFRFGTSNKGRLAITTNEEELRVPYEIIEGVFIETNFSAKSILRFLKALFVQYKIDESCFSVHVIAQVEEDEEDEEENEDSEEENA